MNVVHYGILPLLAMAMLAIVAAAPNLLAALRRQMVAVVAADDCRPRVPFAVLAVAPGRRAVPTDVVPAHQAWRAPPTVWAPDRTDDPADAAGRRSD